MEATIGIVLATAGGVFALVRARSQHSFYAAEVYHMTARSHRRFAALSAIFCAGFLLALRSPVLDLPLLALYTLFLVLYASSFARGFSGEDE